MSAPAWMPGRAVPNSAGTEAPASRVPPDACDAHVHVIDPRFPMPRQVAVAGMTFDDHRIHRARLGTTRTVVVQAKLHGVDHACLLDALERSAGTARGVAVVRPEVGSAELRRLDAAGVRGARFSLWSAADAVTAIDMVEPLARRFADLGWHAQVHMSADQIVAHAELLERLPCRMVFDHMARLPPDRGPLHPAFRVVCRLADAGRAWVKLGGAYLNTRRGPPDYPDAGEIGRSFVAAIPDRLVWGSDWPHVTEPHKPDDARLLDLLRVWCGDRTTFNRVLVENPAGLYGF